MKKTFGTLTSSTWIATTNRVALVSLVGIPTLFANDDPPESTKKTEVKVVVTSDDESDVVQQVMKALEKSDVPAEERAKIIEKLKSKLSNIEPAKGKLRKILNWSSSESGNSGQKDTNVDVTVLDKGNKAFSTRLISPLSTQEDVYRIGISLMQIDGEDGESEGADAESGETDDETKALKKGLVVEDTMADSPAEKVGIKKGDLIVSANGKELTVFTDLMSLVQQAGSEDKAIQLEIDREGKSLTLEVKPTKMKAADIASETLELTLPSGGFVVNPGSINRIVERAQGLGRGNGMLSQVWTGADMSGLEKEVAELKSEIAELKKMIKELADKK